MQQCVYIQCVFTLNMCAFQRCLAYKIIFKQFSVPPP